jgi:GNAT superfamily N-acetyltransferase
MGWVVQAHGELYSREYGWNSNFEALVAEIVAAFLRHHDPARERCWIAECDGVRAGSIFLVRQSDDVAKLRLLLVDPVARGSGLGRRLVRECIDFTRASGYRTLTLWTNDVLAAARHIYATEGFRIVATERNVEFGPETIAETWELTL